MAENHIPENLKKVRRTLREVCAAAGRDPAEVRLIGVSKFHPEEAVRAAHAAGLCHFAENRAQEFRRKYEALRDEEGLHWHFIGHLQRNKVRDVVGRAELIHSVDSPRLLQAIHNSAESANLQQGILLQVNITGETQKYGFEPEAVLDIAEDFELRYPALDWRGLMCMAEYGASESRLQETFDGLRALLARVRRHLSADAAERCRELSMGMSGDYETAVRCGATMIRIGTVIFGEREA